MPFHRSDADFLALEDIVYGFTRRLHHLDGSDSQESDSEDDDSSDSDDHSGADGGPCPNSRHRRASLNCPVCKTVHPYVDNNNSNSSNNNSSTNSSSPNSKFSHDARVIYASFACPICLEDNAGPPMVVLPCGHAICQDDFRLLGGKTHNEREDAQVRQAARQETQQHRQELRQRRQERRQERQQQQGSGGQENRRLQNRFGLFNGFFDDAEDDSTMDAAYRSLRSSREQAESELDVAMRMIAATYGMMNPYDHPFEDQIQQQRATASATTGRQPDRSTGTSTGTTDPPNIGIRAVLEARAARYRNATTTTTTTQYDYDAREDAVSDYEDSDYFEFNTSADDDSDDDSEDDSNNEDEEDDFDLEDPDAILWRLSQYHPGNMRDADIDTIDALPKIGQWLLVPEMANDGKVNLVYYSEQGVQHGHNNIEVAKQFFKGTRLIPNGKHGVYVHAPTLYSVFSGVSAMARNQDPDNERRLWDVFYIRNYKYNQPFEVDANHHQLSPILRYKIPRQAHIVPDGKGGMWALCPESSLPASVVRSSLEDETDTNATANTSTQPHPNHSNNDNRRHQRDKRDYVLVHYSREEGHREGQVVGNKLLPPYCRIFMDRSGGVFLLQPNQNNNNSGQQSFSSLWHVSIDRPDRPTLLYGGIPHRTTKVIGDSNGTSLFLLSSGGRLQSILTRVKVEQDPALPANSSAVRSKTYFSYDLDIPVEAIKDIVDDCGDGDGNDDDTNMHQVYLHCRQPLPRSGNNGFVWNLCRVGPARAGTAAASERDAQVVPLDADCPRNSRIVSDREGGVWVWKKPSLCLCPGDRGLVHYCPRTDVGEGGEEWHSPCVFPPQTLLAGCRL